MLRLAILLTALLLAGCSGDDQPPAPKPDGFKEITFDASDGKKVYADFFPSSIPDSEKVVLMFHQAGSNAGEYESIEPAIAPLGYDCIAVDQRSGGDMWGRSNRTVEKSGDGDYMGAYNDLQGALKYAEGKNYTTIVAWGSSYSAALVLRLAAENSTVKGVIAFSPGEYMPEQGIVKSWASKVSVPVFFACTPDEWNDGRSDIYAAIPSAKKFDVHLEGGVHGSSTLLPKKSDAAKAYLDKVKSFLTDLKAD